MYGWIRDLSIYSSTETFPSMTSLTLHDIMYFIPLNLFQKELFQYNVGKMRIKLHDTFPKSPTVNSSKILTQKTNMKFPSKKADKYLSEFHYFLFSLYLINMFLYFLINID